METDKTLNSQLFESREDSLNGTSNWTFIEVAKVVSRLNSEDCLSDDQATQIIAMFQEDDSRLKNLPKPKVSESDIEKILLEIAKVEFPPKSEYKTALESVCKRAMHDSSRSQTISSLKLIRRSLENIIQNKPKSFILPGKNFSVQKYILNSPNSMRLMELLGFELREEGVGKMLTISKAMAQKRINKDVVAATDEAIAVLTSSKEEIGRKGFCVHDELEKKEKISESKQTHCAANCGFFGSEKTMGLCSSCYRKNKNRIFKRSPQQKCLSALHRLGLIHWWVKITKTEQNDCSRCWKCNKRIGFLSIRCECKYYFCPLHRSPLDHCCPFDYKKKFEKRLLRENPSISSKKIDEV